MDRCKHHFSHTPLLFSLIIQQQTHRFKHARPTAYAAREIVPTGVDPVSTFAWFGVSNTLAATHAEANKGGLSVAKADVTVAKTLQHLLQITVTSGSPVTGLAHYNGDVATPKLSTGYIDGGGSFQDVGGTNGLTLTSSFTIKVEINWKAFADGWGWTDSYSKYTEDGITYTKAEILEDIVTQTLVKVSVKPSTDSRIRFYATNAAENDPSFGDLTAVTSAGSLEKGKVDNVSANSGTTQGYLWFDTISFAGFANAAQTDETQKSVSTTATTKYYVLGKNGNSDNNKDNAAVGGPIDVRLD